MKKVLRGVPVAIISGILILTTILFPFSNNTSAAFNYSTEAGLKTVLTYLAYYDCINQYGNLMQDTAVGNKADSILASAENYTVWVGTWMAPGSGTMNCKDVINKVHTSNISASMLNTNAIFSGVYEYGTSNEKKIKCNYQIVNSEATGYISGTYSWPQGYYYGANGLVDARSHGAIWVVYDENGPIRTEPTYSDVNPNLLDSIKQWSIDWSQDGKICKNLVKYTEVYKVEGEDLQGNAATFYANIEATDDATPLNEWPFDLYDGNNANQAWCNNANGTFTHTVESVTDNTKLVLTSNAQAQLKANISRIYLDGATDLNGILSKSANLKYILYGRYLFNGDGGYADGCNGTTIKASESSKVDPQFWDTSLSYVSSISAYESGTAASKTSFLTKFGGNGVAQAGSTKDVALPGGYYGSNYISCTDLATSFNGVSVSASAAKSKVAEYMGVAEVEELPENNDNAGGSGGNTNNNSGGSQKTNNEQEEACYHEAGSLGWIICPMIFGMNDFIQGIYEKHIEPLLKPDKAIIKDLSDSSSALHTSWGDFRDFANIIFVAVLLIIIFSQVTGFGIDNFGIKRMLPKLIIAAVLVNLSFIICALVVDASNIAGRGIYNLMTTLGDSITPQDELGASGTAGSYAAVIIQALILALTGAGAAAAITAQGWLIILPILLLALSVVISVLFLFITLGIRQAAIIMFIILAPLGLVMYILPNTHSLFKKWVSIFSALLLVYPIASLLIGAGYFVARMLIVSGSDNIMMYLVAGLVSVAPYFFIPSIVSNSMKGLGNIGAKIQGAGKSLGKGATRAIGQGVRNTPRYQNAANRRLDARQARFQDSQLRRYAKRKDGIRGYLPGGRVRDEYGHYEMDEDRINAMGERPTSGPFKNARANANAARLREIATASSAIASNDVGLARSKASMAMSNLKPTALAAVEADYEEAEIEKAIKANESLVKATEDYKTGNNAALQSRLEQAARDKNMDLVRALTNLMMETDKGREAMLKGVANVLDDNSGVDGAIKGNIINDLKGGKHGGALKSNNRSAYDTLKTGSITSDGKVSGVNLDALRGGGAGVNFGNYSNETLGGSDDLEMAKFGARVSELASIAKNSNDAQQIKNAEEELQKAANLVHDTQSSARSGAIKVKQENLDQLAKMEEEMAKVGVHHDSSTKVRDMTGTTVFEIDR